MNEAKNEQDDFDVISRKHSEKITELLATGLFTAPVDGIYRMGKALEDEKANSDDERIKVLEDAILSISLALNERIEKLEKNNDRN